MDMEFKPHNLEEEDALGGFGTDEIQQHMNDLEREMNLHVEKKQKYKKLYYEEKARNRDLQLEMAEQLEQKDTEIEQLRKRIKEMLLELGYKLQSVEKCVADKEADIEMLYQKLRESIKEKEVLKAAASSPKQMAAASSGSSDPNGTECPNKADVDDVIDTMGMLNLAASENVIHSAPPVHEDRFLDAPGEPMKLCPVCNKSFPMNVADQDFENHVMDHVEGICPVCRMGKGENMTDDDFMRHVNKHYDEENDAN